MFSQQSVNTLNASHCHGWLPRMTKSVLFLKPTAFFLTSSAVILSVSPWISCFVLLTLGEKQLSNTDGVFHWEPQEHESRKAQLTVKHLPTCLYGIQLHWWCVRHQSFHRVQADHSRPCDPCLLDKCGTFTALYELRLLVTRNEMLIFCMVRRGSRQFQHGQGHRSPS